MGIAPTALARRARFVRGNGQVVESSDSTERRLAAQQAVIGALIEAEDLDDAFRRVIREVAQALGWPVGVAWAQRAGDDGLRVAAFWSVAPYERFESETRALRLRAGEGLPGRVWSSGAPLWLDDIASAENFPRAASAGAVGLRSALAFPVCLRDGVRAVLEFYSPEPGEPDVALLDTLAAIGQQMGLFVRRWEVEARLREQEERFRLMSETSTDVVIVIDERSTIRFVNTAVEQVFGWRARELIGKPLTVLMPPDMRERHADGLRHFVETGERRIGWSAARLPGLRRDGSAVPLEISFGTFVQDGRRLFTGIMRDVSDRLEQQERLEQAAAELEATVEQLEEQRAAAEGARAEAEQGRERAMTSARWSSFIAEAGRALGTSLDREDTLRTLAGLAVPAIADYCLVDFVHEDGSARRLEVAGDGAAAGTVQEAAPRKPREARRAVLARHGAPQVMRTGEPQLHTLAGEKELKAIAGDDEHLESLRGLGLRSMIVAPLVARGRTLGAITLATGDSGRTYDVTDLTIVEALAGRAALALDNAALYEQALTANRAKVNFLAVMSHELRTPLTAIMGYTDILEAGIAGDLDQRQREYLERVMVSARHLLSLIDEILTFSRLEVGRERPRAQSVPLAEFTRKTASLVRPALREKGLQFDVQAPEQDVTVQTDPEKLRQVLVDVLMNAVKFTRRGKVTLSARVEGADICFEVADTGIGIRREHLERIFDPFWQAEDAMTRQEGGTGIGLSVARRLTLLLGGDIRVASTPGEGTVFTIRVPAAADDRAAA